MGFRWGSERRAHRQFIAVCRGAGGGFCTEVQAERQLIGTTAPAQSKIVGAAGGSFKLRQIRVIGLA